MHKIMNHFFRFVKALLYEWVQNTLQNFLIVVKHVVDHHQQRK
jgi:hypothetical protein